MPKSNLTLEDIEQIKKSKGVLSASEVQRKYGIGWGRLQKIWDDRKSVMEITKQEPDNIQREIVPQGSIPEGSIPQHKEIVVEDFYAKLGQLEAKMERQTTQMERQTELMQNILDSLDAVSDIESDTQSILEKENKESYTLQDIGKSMQEYMDFSKTLVYCGLTGFAVWQLLCKTWKHIDNKTETKHVDNPPPPQPKPTRPSLFKKEPDPFDF